LENQTLNLSDQPNIIYFNGSVVRMYVIHSKSMIDNDLDENNPQQLLELAKR